MVTEEPEYKPAKLEQLLGQNRPGEVLRNLLLAAARDAETWESLVRDVRELFQIELLPPDSSGADIVAAYSPVGANLVRFDIASGGSGFQQVLMLLAFLGTRGGSVLLLDEPDAHLHVFLQERIHQRLTAAAARTGSQLIMATHSEVIIDGVEHGDVYVVIDQPVRLVESGATDPKRLAALKAAMRWLGNTDLMKARMSPGVLYLEGSTDLQLLRAWARVLKHPALQFLEPSPFWRPVTRAQVDDDEGDLDGPGVSARAHFESLRLARPDYPGLLIEDRDDKPLQPSVFGSSPPTARWVRREIESYLVHPDALARFVEQRVGAGAASAQHRTDLQKHFADQYPPAFLRDPLGDHPMLANTRARSELLGNALIAAGLPGVDYRGFHEIAAVMLPAEIHPDIVAKLDAICTAFGIPLPPASPPAGAAP